MPFGPPKNVPGECNAHLRISDDYGDNAATMRCSQKAGHDGLHRETYRSKRAGAVIVEWERDERVPLGEPLTVEELMRPVEEEDLDEDDD